MRIRVLGCCGGSSPGREPSCYLLEHGVAVDAGSLASRLTLEEQRGVEHVFLTHAHWDHVRDLPLTTINRRAETPPLVVHGLAETIQDIQTHLMNDRVWFAAFDLPSPDTPYVASATISPGETVECNGYRITAVEMPHTVPAIGYLVDDDSAAVLFCADTVGGDLFHSLPPSSSPLRAVFLEASLPNEMREFAILTGHLTPEMLGAEIAALPEDVLVMATHMKPGFEEQLETELLALGRPNLRVCVDGEILDF